MIKENSHFYILSNKYLSLEVYKTFDRKKEENLTKNESIKLTLKEFKKIKKLFHNIYIGSDFVWNKSKKWTLKEILKRVGLVNNIKNQLKLVSWLGWIRDIRLHKLPFGCNCYSVINDYAIKNRYLTVYLGPITITEITMINEMFDELEQKLEVLDNETN